MSTFKKMVIAAVLALATAAAAAPAQAQLTGCQYTTGSMQLQKVRSTAVGSQIIGCINATFDTLSSGAISTTSLAAVGVATAALSAGGATTYVTVNGDTMTGALNRTIANGENGIYATSNSGIGADSSVGFKAKMGHTSANSIQIRNAADGADLLTLNEASGLYGTTAWETTQGITAGSFSTTSSVTASAFFGDGSHLTGLSQSTATVIRDYNGNATVPYGLLASTLTLANGTPSLPAIVGTDADTGITFGGAGLDAKSINYIRDGTAYWSFAGQTLVGYAASTIRADAELKIQSTGNKTMVGSNNTPATILDVEGNFQAGSGATKSTFTATGSMVLSSSAGVGHGTSVATMSVTGMLYFVSSTTVTGSTCTVGGNTTVSFSTYTFPANTIFKPGDSVMTECFFVNSVNAPTSPVIRIDQGFPNGSTAFGSSSINTASQFLKITTIVTMARPGIALYTGDIWANTKNGNNTRPVISDNGHMDGVSYDFTTAKTFKCSAEENGGGRINFLWMKVSKL